MFSAGVDGDAYRRLTIGANGTINIGDGTAARDTNLYREAANHLKTDDDFTVVGALTVDGESTFNDTVKIYADYATDGQIVGMYAEQDNNGSGTTLGIGNQGMFKLNQTGALSTLGTGCYGNAQFGPSALGSSIHVGDAQELTGTCGVLSLKWGQTNVSGYPNITNACGVSAIWNNSTLSAGPTVTNLILFHGYSLASDLTSGKATNVMGVYIEDITQAGSTNNYGMKLDNISGATNNYAIHTGTGDVYFGDDLTLATGKTYNVGSANGWSGTFTNGDGDTVTVTGGIITDVS